MNQKNNAARSRKRRKMVAPSVAVQNQKRSWSQAQCLALHKTEDHLSGGGPKSRERPTRGPGQLQERTNDLENQMSDVVATQEDSTQDMSLPEHQIIRDCVVPRRRVQSLPQEQAAYHQRRPQTS
ncbi:hypothetical protein FKM82_030616 [Ascaphus truei]